MRRWLQKFLILAVAVVGLVALFPAAAFADDPVAVSNQVVANGERLVTISLPIWNLIVGGLLPFVTSFLVKLDGRNGVKIIINALVSALTGLIGTAVIAQGTAILSSTSILNALFTFFVSTLAYIGLYKKTNIPAALPLANKGFG